jgi:hypothetical protein
MHINIDAAWDAGLSLQRQIRNLIHIQPTETNVTDLVFLCSVNSSQVPCHCGDDGLVAFVGWEMMLLDVGVGLGQVGLQEVAGPFFVPCAARAERMVC